MGFKPGVVVRASELRLPTKEESQELQIPMDETIYYMERAITADGKVTEDEIAHLREKLRQLEQLAAEKPSH